MRVYWTSSEEAEYHFRGCETLGIELNEVLSTLSYYSKDRDFWREQGGYVIVYESVDELSHPTYGPLNLHPYSIEPPVLEFASEHFEKGSLTWYAALTLLSAEFGIYFVIPTEFITEDIKQWIEAAL